MPKRIFLPNDFTPRDYQKRFMRYFDTGGKRAIWVVHRRGGKDLTALHQTCKMAHLRVGAYWHIFPIAEQARKAIWEGFTKDGKRIMEQVFPREIRKSPRDFTSNGEMVVTLKNGSIWRLQGSDKMEVVGAGPVGVVFSEFALAKPRTWDLVRPMLRENGGWAAFVSTPRGNNHCKRLFDLAQQDPSWFCERQTLYDTRAYDPEATIAEERASGMPEALIQQEYMCDWTAANVGAVWGDLISSIEQRGGVCEFEHPRDGIFTAWDLGFSDSTAIWAFRIVDGGVDVVGYHEAHGKPLSYYFDVLEDWENTLGFRFVRHFLPHDARAKTLATGASIIERFRERVGGDKVEIGPELSLLDGIQAARWLLQRNVRFHSRASEGVEVLKAYRYHYDEDKKTFSTKPVHDWSSHGSDSWRGVACVLKRGSLALPEPTRPPLARVEAVQPTLDELYSIPVQTPRPRRV